jgi:peptidoglycan/xylan/chitin deacetylase (PgdA/CDA1 family)
MPRRHESIGKSLIDTESVGLPDLPVRYLRFDVDNPYVSRLKSYRTFRLGLRDDRYLRYVEQVLAMLDDHEQKGSFFFRPRYTLPNKALTELILGRGHEIGHHVDRTRDISKMREEKTILEEDAGTVLGITIHGRGLPVLSPSGDGYHDKYLSYCAELGYAYEGTGLRNEFDTYEKLVVFPAHTTLDRELSASIQSHVMLLHPCRLLRSKTVRSVFEKVLKTYRFVPMKEALDHVHRAHAALR